MQILRIFFLAVAIIVASGFLPYPNSLLSRANRKADLQILMIGNSFTFGGSMPEILAAILAQAEVVSEIDVVAPGGKFLAWHSENFATLAALKKHSWDVVVLQDCSACPLEYKDYFVRGIRKMVELVRESGSQPMLFMTWADRDKNLDFKTISTEYVSIGSELGVEIVPVGKAWNALWESNNNIPVYADDNHHASRLGALLTAYVFALRLAPHKEINILPSLPETPRFLYHAVFPPKGTAINEGINKLLLEQARSVMAE